MTIVLDSLTEERLEREMARKGFASPAEFIASALDVMEVSSAEYEAWKQDLSADLEDRSAAVDRGEFYTAEEAQVLLAQYRARQIK